MTKELHVISEVAAADIERVKSLWGELLNHHHDIAPALASLGRPLSLEESWALRRGQYVRWFSEAKGRLWVATQNNVPTGYCFVHLADANVTWDMGTKTGVLESLLVTSSARGDGLGTQLITLAYDYFVENHALVAKVSAIASNEEALKLYRRQGFIEQMVTLVKSVDRPSGR